MSPKPDSLFERLKMDLAPEIPGFHVLWAIHWSRTVLRTVRATSLKSVIDNYERDYEVLLEESQSQLLEGEMRACIIGVLQLVCKPEKFSGFYQLV